MTSETEPRTARSPTLDLRRWLVVGCSGAGKSRFSIELGRILDLPVVHLDQHYWLPGWVEPTRAEWRRRVSALGAHDEWVMDGNYGGTLELRLRRADAVVLLDVPTWRCVWGVCTRSIRHRGTIRPDLAEGCPERLPDPGFLWYVLSYRSRRREKVLATIARASHVHFERFTSRTEASAWLEQMARVGARAG